MYRHLQLKVLLSLRRSGGSAGGDSAPGARRRHYRCTRVSQQQRLLTSCGCCNDSLGICSVSTATADPAHGVGTAAALESVCNSLCWIECGCYNNNLGLCYVSTPSAEIEGCGRSCRSYGSGGGGDSVSWTSPAHCALGCSSSCCSIAGF